MGATALNLYLLGGACLLWAVVYPQFGEAGPELPALHASVTGHLRLAFIVPELLSFFAMVPLLWRRPEGVPAWPAWVAVGLGLAYFAITFGWHLPAHGRLARGDASAEVMGALMTSHAVRTVTVALRCGALLWMASVAGWARAGG
ncbi:MAG TPA: hypothetical protein VFA20_32610 [Myxococcaceae bacterium]|nr:hypothetical protein [Myxococcaceae bacterium]